MATHAQLEAKNSPRRPASAMPLTARPRSPRSPPPTSQSLAALAARRSASVDALAQEHPHGSTLRSPRRMPKPASPSAASAASGTSRGTEDGTTNSDREKKMSTYEADRAKKAAEMSAKAIENRIRYFQREEERIWRDIEEVRRQASAREEGRNRVMERKMASQVIREAREGWQEENRAKASSVRTQLNDALAKEPPFVQRRAIAGQDQRRMSQEATRAKRLHDKQTMLRNTERAVAIQKAQLEARIRAAQQKSERIQGVRDQQERHRMAMEQEVYDAEAKLPALEAEEMVCIQRLQNSRVVTQSVLEELESSLGSRASVATLLRARHIELQDEHNTLHHVHEESNGVSGNGSDQELRQ